MTKSGSSQRWLSEHFSDEYVKLAQQRGYRSRAVFKLEEIDSRDRLIRPGMSVVDLGAAPGGWSQYVAGKIGKHGRIIALDILPVEAIPGVEIIQGDFQDEQILNQVLQALEGKPVDLVLSDMAPNMSGTRVVDQTRAIYLAELALDMARLILKPGGAFVAKLFMGAGFEEYQKNARNSFSGLANRKPKASRDRSREVYLVGKGFKG
ncbi:MAG: 23S rRNA (uridine(2552)-2'-O)-methyltransferase RlmE [Candidatus Methylumidiphilus alinenensis]|uniref:Ribosomal RNA large subunit methyltransferase E n=1 Tax=Candidatus Methylumidiphilus alinenensis TaxID=2202197 RepID=A0A2W4T223_9GAMM|nr:MAG: 23S rRNA (uridine(2552)-2'-O)-methyltransferase RlmE [Candidatus Methylumidiphilus alinenensis]